ncbi:PRC-barrel domain-containing protein [Aestuariivirga litoralis]|nr:PRC-barrel domain-containing protein [Aestuariivirga litoralis]
MNRNVLALSTALSILAFTPVFAQNAAVDCTQEANKNDPACMSQQNNTTNATQDQNGAATTTDQNAAQSGSSTSTTTDQNNAQNTTATTQGTTTQMSGGALIVPADRLNGVQLMSASDYIGKTVYDQAGNNIGDVNDLIVSGDGNVEAVILGVGGFLGIGEKDVAVNTEAIKIVTDGDNKRLVVEATKEVLENAPTYDRNNRRYADQMNGTATESTGSTTQPAPANNNGNATGNTGGSGTVDCALPENATNAACTNQTQQQ